LESNRAGAHGEECLIRDFHLSGIITHKEVIVTNHHLILIIHDG
jgi:hypothetical protein